MTSDRESSLQQEYSKGQESALVSGILVEAVPSYDDSDCHVSPAKAEQGHKFSFSGAVYKNIMSGFVASKPAT